jgi:hypothetical protein
LRTDVPEGTGKMYKCLGWRNWYRCYTYRRNCKSITAGKSEQK